MAFLTPEGNALHRLTKEVVFDILRAHEFPMIQIRAFCRLALILRNTEKIVGEGLLPQTLVQMVSIWSTSGKLVCRQITLGDFKLRSLRVMRKLLQFTWSGLLAIQKQTILCYPGLYSTPETIYFSLNHAIQMIYSSVNRLVIWEICLGNIP